MGSRHFNDSNALPWQKEYQDTNSNVKPVQQASMAPCSSSTTPKQINCPCYPSIECAEIHLLEKHGNVMKFDESIPSILKKITDDDRNKDAGTRSILKVGLKENDKVMANDEPQQLHSILKRCSLDEGIFSTNSCDKSCSILKKWSSSEAEANRRTSSPELLLTSILRRKSAEDAEGVGGNISDRRYSILRQKSLATGRISKSSASMLPNVMQPHSILKKQSSTEELEPRPILKKFSIEDQCDFDLRPILKNRNNVYEEPYDMPKPILQLNNLDDIPPDLPQFMPFVQAEIFQTPFNQPYQHEHILKSSLVPIYSSAPQKMNLHEELFTASSDSHSEPLPLPTAFMGVANTANEILRGVSFRANVSRIPVLQHFMDDCFFFEDCSAFISSASFSAPFQHFVFDHSMDISSAHIASNSSIYASKVHDDMSTNEDEVLNQNVDNKALVFMQKPNKENETAVLKRLNSRRISDRRQMQRSRTQPVTAEEVHKAALIVSSENIVYNATLNAVDDRSKFSIANRVALYNKKMIPDFFPMRKSSVVDELMVQFNEGTSNSCFNEPVMVEELKLSSCTSLDSSAICPAGLYNETSFCKKGYCCDESPIEYSSFAGFHDKQALLVPSHSNASLHDLRPTSETFMESLSVNFSDCSTCSGETVISPLIKEKENYVGKNVRTVNGIREKHQAPGVLKTLGERKKSLQRSQEFISKTRKLPHVILPTDGQHVEVVVECSGNAQTVYPVHNMEENTGIIQVKDVAMTAEVQGSIKERLAALQKSQIQNWKDRLNRIKTVDDASDDLDGTMDVDGNNFLLSSQSKECTASKILSRVSLLENSQNEWRKRVEANDATKFTVAGKLNEASKSDELPSTKTSVSTLPEKSKRIAKPVRFQGKTDLGEIRVNSSIPPAFLLQNPLILDDCSMSGGVVNSNQESYRTENLARVSIPKLDDESFSSFFQSANLINHQFEKLEIDEGDFNCIASQCRPLLIQKRTVPVARRHVVNSNHLKALASYSDFVQQTYMEVKSGIADKELRRTKVEELAKHSNLAASALAGLISTEDFTAIYLRHKSSKPLPFQNHVMLLHIKGRRHVQTRLAEPTITSITTGDNFVLVTANKVYNFIGRFCNVIERAKVWS